MNRMGNWSWDLWERAAMVETVSRCKHFSTNMRKLKPFASAIKFSWWQFNWAQTPALWANGNLYPSYIDFIHLTKHLTFIHTWFSLAHVNCSRNALTSFNSGHSSACSGMLQILTPLKCESAYHTTQKDKQRAPKETITEPCMECHPYIKFGMQPPPPHIKLEDLENNFEVKGLRGGLERKWTKHHTISLMNGNHQ